jgi:sugar lactone lactonase YvrE
MSSAERITDVCTTHGEGPVWDGNVGALRLVDMLAGDVLTMGASGEVTRRHVASVAAVIRPRAAGGLIVAVERGFAFADANWTLQVQPELWSDAGVRMNEGGCDPQGRFYCGSMAYDESTGRGRLYRLDLDGSVEVVLDEVTVSNGLAWTPEGDVVYYNDSPTGIVRRFGFDAATGSLVDGEPFVRIDPGDGVPDGLTVDAAGDVWVALWGGGAVRHYTAAGELADVISLPVPLVTACAFGGDDLSELYITTSRLLPEGQRPEAGALFRCRPGATGQPTLTFGA